MNNLLIAKRIVLALSGQANVTAREIRYSTIWHVAIAVGSCADWNDQFKISSAFADILCSENGFIDLADFFAANHP